MLAPKKNGTPIFLQKGVDLQLGLDFALLAGKHQVPHAAIIPLATATIPAVTVAKQEGVCVWLFRGPASTYAQPLWDAADERFAMDQAFMASAARSAHHPRSRGRHGRPLDLNR